LSDDIQPAEETTALRKTKEALIPQRRITMKSNQSFICLKNVVEMDDAF